jgi:hypothetical protein
MGNPSNEPRASTSPNRRHADSVPLTFVIHPRLSSGSRRLLHFLSKPQHP